MNNLSGVWHPTNVQQSDFLRRFHFPNEAQHIDGLRSLLTRSCDELNKELSEAGFDLRVSPFSGIGLLGIFVLKLLWEKYKTSIRPIRMLNDRWYRGAQLESCENNFFTRIFTGHP